MGLEAFGRVKTISEAWRIESYSDPKQRPSYVRVGTKRKGPGQTKGSPNPELRAKFKDAPFHLEPKVTLPVHGYTVRHNLYTRERRNLTTPPLLTWSGNELQEVITWIAHAFTHR